MYKDIKNLVVDLKIGNLKLSAAFLLHWMKMEVNNTYDLLLKLLFLEKITLYKLLVLSFPERLVVYQSRVFRLSSKR